MSHSQEETHTEALQTHSHALPLTVEPNKDNYTNMHTERVEGERGE